MFFKFPYLLIHLNVTFMILMNTDEVILHTQLYNAYLVSKQ